MVPAAQPQSAGPFTTQSSSNQNSRRKKGDRDSYQATDPIPSAGSRTVDTDGDTDAPFVIILTLPKCLGSNEAKKLIRELKTKLTFSRDGDGLCGVGRIIGLHARDCQARWRHSVARDFIRSGHSSGTLSNGPPVTEISLGAAANSGFCCCHNRYCPRSLTCGPPPASVVAA